MSRVPNHRSWRFLSQYFAKGESGQMGRALEAGGLEAPYSVEGLMTVDDDGVVDPARVLHRSGGVHDDAMSHLAGGDFVPKPPDAAPHPLDPSKHSLFTPLSSPSDHRDGNTVASVLSAYLPSMPSMPSLPKLASYFPSRRASHAGTESDGDVIEEVPLPPIDPESERLVNYLRVVREVGVPSFAEIVCGCVIPVCVGGGSMCVCVCGVRMCVVGAYLCVSV